MVTLVLLLQALGWAATNVQITPAAVRTCRSAQMKTPASLCRKKVSCSETLTEPVWSLMGNANMRKTEEWKMSVLHYVKWKWRGSGVISSIFVYDGGYFLISLYFSLWWTVRCGSSTPTNSPQTLVYAKWRHGWDLYRPLGGARGRIWCRFQLSTFKQVFPRL